jgi:hypothetical protein
MNTLKSVRQEISVQLSAAGISNYEFVPSRVNVPAAIIEPGSPYMEQGETFADFTVRMNVVLLVAGTTNDTATDELDQLIVNAIDALDTFDIEAVGSPEGFELNAAQYLGSRLNLVTTKDLIT